MSEPNECVNTRPALNIATLVKEHRAMSNGNEYGKRARACKSEQPENFKSIGRLSEDLVQRYMASWPILGASFNQDAETRYYMQMALDRIRPSLMFVLMKAARDQGHFLDLVQQAICAASMPQEAETIAANACATFTPDEAIKHADAVWEVMLMCAAMAAEPDPEWGEVNAISDRVRGAFGSPKKTLLEQLLSADDATPVFVNPLDSFGGKQ